MIEHEREEKRMSTWCYYSKSLFHQYVPRLLITYVPDDKTVTEDMVKRAGYLPKEGSIGETYDVVRLDMEDSPAELIGRIRRSKVERITYADLVAQIDAPL